MCALTSPASAGRFRAEHIRIILREVVASIRGVMAITKCRIWVPPVNRFTVTARALRQRGRTSDWMVRAGLMEKIMSFTER